MTNPERLQERLSKRVFPSSEKRLIVLLGKAVDLLSKEMYYDNINRVLLEMIGFTEDEINRFGFSVFTER